MKTDTYWKLRKVLQLAPVAVLGCTLVVVIAGAAVAGLEILSNAYAKSSIWTGGARERCKTIPGCQRVEYIEHSRPKASLSFRQDQVIVRVSPGSSGADWKLKLWPQGVPLLYPDITVDEAAKLAPSLPKGSKS